MRVDPRERSEVLEKPKQKRPVRSEPARRRATLADVARLAGLSRTAASMILTGRPDTRLSAEAHAKVMAAADQLGYRPNVAARSLRTDRTQSIAFISDVVATTRFATGLIRGALQAAEERSHVMLVLETGGEPARESEAINAALDRQVDGIIFAAMRAREVFVPARVEAPVVMLNATNPHFPVSVLPDEIEGGRAAARLLLDAGHRDGIHLIGVGPGLRDVPPETVAGIERLTGIREILSAARVKPASGRICADWQPEYGYEATRDLLEHEQPRALICLNDRLSIGAYQALDDFGLKVPDDVSVVSFDDHPIATWIRPRLTTIALPHYELGRAAVDVLFAEIDRHRAGTEPTTTVHRVPMPVRPRDSVAPAGA